MNRTRMFLLAVGLIASSFSYAMTNAGDSSTANHSQFETLKGPFSSGPEVTKACLECHTEAASQLHDTLHWQWEFTQPSSGEVLGKKHVVNNFCISTNSNEPRCTSCHIGYGWKDKNFDLTSEENIDCLVCHDTTGTYKKFPTDAGHPNYKPKEWPKKSGKVRQPVDLANVAQHVGDPQRENCGACHFYGGGGDGVKHGDMDSSLIEPDKQLDVHMAADGADFACQTCHTTSGHQTAGSRYEMVAKDQHGVDVPGHFEGGLASCESCHDTQPHQGEEANRLNSHTARIACATCHIPEFARQRKTKTFWDWSAAGKLTEKGKRITEKDDEGYKTYITKKGRFEWERNVQPEYAWFNGKTDYTHIGEKISKNADGVINLTRIQGAYADPDSRIWPFKIMKSVQPYDTKQQVMALPHIFGNDPTGYWKNLDWNKAVESGMQTAGLEFSGELEFVNTRYMFPIVHMVAPADDALSCRECHTRDNSRLANLTDFYLPGRDQNRLLDSIGWLAVFATLGAVLLHGLMRIITRSKGE